ncbi:hypothetical protein BZG01_00585 [Labilibaculum manganireducens]|uniref:Uncharacterized protein n=1 Tax=Labilibaculum manganireducens TaxID=1940525 RepID=A0A2N3IGK8_9BACT|nr:hypothetical protein BZG01_00585 [Labilibaculum manganireducens]
MQTMMNGKQINSKTISSYWKKLGDASGNGDFLLVTNNNFLTPKPKLLGSIELRTTVYRVFFDQKGGSNHDEVWFFWHQSSIEAR